MSDNKLYYFHGRGNSQQSRWALAAAKIPFTNVCLSKKSEFTDLGKSGKLTYGQVPMLETASGTCISQSMAIVRHAARLGNLYGSDDNEAARVDEVTAPGKCYIQALLPHWRRPVFPHVCQVLEGIRDARGPIVSYPFMDAQEACMRLQGSIERFFPHFEALIERNATAPHVVGSSTTIADVLLAELVHSSIEAFDATFGDTAASQILEPYTKCRALHAHVLGLPEIKGFTSGPNWFPFPAGQVGRDYVRNVQTVLR